MTRIKNILLWSIVFVAFGSNILNYFYFYKVLDDWEMQWRFAMWSISLTLFLMSMYIWVASKYKMLAGWLSLYLFLNFIGVLIGYDLHTKGFMAILFVTTFFGICYLTWKLWPR